MSKLPDICPACGSECSRHQPQSETEYEWRDYACGSQLILEEGNIEIGEDCHLTRSPLEQAVETLNKSKTKTDEVRSISRC
jgi:hypothetical protein